MVDIIAIPAITVLCYLVAEVYKGYVSEKNFKHIPAICGVTGAAMGVVSYIWMQGYIPAENPLVAAAIGAVSGWAATGANQVIRQWHR